MCSKDDSESGLKCFQCCFGQIWQNDFKSGKYFPDKFLHKIVKRKIVSVELYNIRVELEKTSNGLIVENCLFSMSSCKISGGAFICFKLKKIKYS